MSLLKANKASEPRKQLKRRTVVGDKRCLVILVEFPDLKFDTSTNYEGKDPNHADPQLRFDGIFNKKGYNYYGYYGSVRDYFEDQSNGKLRLNFDVVGPVMASHNHDYYGRDWANKTRELVAEACTAVDENVDFSKYDWDEKGEVDQVILIYAGLGQSVVAMKLQYGLINRNSAGKGKFLTACLWIPIVALLRSVEVIWEV